MFIKIVCFLSALFYLSSCLSVEEFHPPSVPLKTVPQGLIDLIRAYPEHLILSYPDALWWKDGTIMTYDESRQYYSVPVRIYQLDLERQMSIPYPKGEYEVPPPEGHDPGRYRYIPFFQKMYGGSREDVEKNLVPLKWLSGRTIYVTRINDVDKKMAAIIEELKGLNQELKKYVFYSMGAFNYRNMLDSRLLSPHSFGIAIDIDAKYSHYWQWDYGHLERGARFRSKIEYKNNIPLEIVKIFENHGFIWGGKWYHYDTMHFEYRPELLLGQ